MIFTACYKLAFAQAITKNAHGIILSSTVYCHFFILLKSGFLVKTSEIAPHFSCDYQYNFLYFLHNLYYFIFYTCFIKEVTL